ncbi:hypothetical protein GFD17_07860 [Bifidobacterium sp. SMB2]|uniref:Lipoprotein n=1 Tax=Bifidobacterium saimiriisciurei TaxID=2661627 RepID=A0ABX0CAV0_9BIFI|nr:MULTISPECIES: hypothetical protein [Bifidobacterium]NEG96665.1 hypothetical protein [Bifidobacterium sp. SMB2]NEH11821.1 hypothetical protein [Bifidobacterium saimiriisciurei]
MQTLCAQGESDVNRSTRRASFSLPLFAALMAVISLFAFCVPAHAIGLSGQGTDDSELSPCEQALTLATRHTRQYQEGLPSSIRLLAASAAQHDWRNVAADCQQRFAEGTVRSALAAHTATSLASKLHIKDISKVTDSPAAQVSSGTTLSIDANAAATLSLAEDRAGFGYEILAARNDADATLYQLSNQRKTNAQILATAVKHEKDPRQKIYSIKSVVNNPATSTDPDTGLTAATTAVIEMNCAVEQLNAMAAVDAADGDDDAASSTSSANSNSSTAGSSTSDSSDGGSSADASGTDSSAVSSTATGSSAINAKERASLTTVSSLISAHILQAIDLGYPALESALLK